MNTLFNFACIAIGGGIGSMLRYAITLAATAVPGGGSPWGTTIANLLGCTAIGALVAAFGETDYLHVRTELALRVGLLGGLTTFSTFAAESVELAGGDRPAFSALYLAVNVLGGLAAVVLGAAAMAYFGPRTA